MSPSAQNGARTPNLMSQSTPALVTDNTDDMVNGVPRVSRANSTSHERRSEERIFSHHDLDRERFLSSRIPTGWSLSELDGSRSPSRKFHLKDVAREMIVKLKITKGFVDKLCKICSRLQLSQDRFIIQDHSSDSHQQAYKSFLLKNLAESKDSFPLGSGSGKFLLGSLQEIKGRSLRCPVCRLVADSLIDFHADKLNDDKYKNIVCFASWQVDGREVTRDASGQIIRARPRTRRIQLHWDHESLEDSYLVLITPGQGRRLDWDPQAPWESNTLYLGRNIASAGNNQALAKRWLDLCNECHGDSCQVQRGKDFEEMIASAFFGVVDVHEMRLTSLPPNQPYAALSYMWGTINQSYTTTLHNIQARQSPGELGKIFQSLPVVIQDAINLVRGLGMKYIWVDALCIVQNSARSWSLNSSLMDQVYGNAHLTICAADGTDARTGLRGISLDRIVSQHSQQCGPVRLMVSHLAETYVENSRWNTRAWTFQERLLSRRCLVFAGNRIFFQCRSAAMSEDIVAEQKKGGWSIELVQAPLQLLQALVTRPFWVYMECLRLYTTRELSHSRDILAAFQALALILLSCGNQLENATYEFPRMNKKQKSLRGWYFPAGHGADGRVVQWSTERTPSLVVSKTFMDGTLITPGSIGTYVTREEISDLYGTRTKPSPSLQRSNRWRGYVAPSADWNNETDNYGRPTQSFHEDQHKYREFSRTLPEYPYKISIADKGPFSNQSHQDQQYLQFWTWSAYLRVIPHDQTNTKLGDGLDRYDIADYTGDWCGTVVLDDPYGDVPGSEHEFIAISDAKEFTYDENDNWTYYVPKDREQSDWGLYYVLLIKRRHGIARRVGLGKVFQEAFANSCLPGMKWREIILE